MVTYYRSKNYHSNPMEVVQLPWSTEVTSLVLLLAWNIQVKPGIVNVEYSCDPQILQ